MTVRPATGRPVVVAASFCDGHIVDARDAQAHEPVFVELPVFVAIGAEPVAGVIMPLVGEADGNSVSVKSP